MQPADECLIFGGVTDEARVELNRLIEQVGQIFNVFVGKTTPAKKRKGKRSGLGEGSMVKDARTKMMTGIQSPHIL